MTVMQFGFASAFFWLLLAIPIAIFYILKVRLRRVPVATTMFWDQLFEEKQARSIWQRLRHLVSLLLQLAFLALVVFALSDPYLPWEALKSRRIVLIVDNSASMNATDVSPTRLDEVKSKANTLINGLRWKDEMAIISASSTARVEVGLTSHQRTLKDTLKKIKATDGTNCLESAMEVADRLLSDHQRTTVYLMTDGCTPNIDAIAKREDVKLVKIGNTIGNAGITQFQVRRSLIDPIGYQILVGVSNFSDEPLETRLDVDIGDSPVDALPLKLKPGEQWSHVLDHVSAEGGQITAKLNSEDAFPADNTAMAILPARERVKVLLFTEGSLFLQKVFEAIPYVDLYMTSDLNTPIPRDATVVYHRLVPTKSVSATTLFIDPQSSCPAFDVGPDIETPMVTKQDEKSELMTYVRLNNVMMPEARKISFKDEATILVESVSGDPLFATIESREKSLRQAVLTVNLSKGDLPLRTAFPILITNVMSWFQGDKGELRQAVPTGSVVRLELAELRDKLPQTETAGTLLLMAPDGNRRELPGDVEEISIGPLQQQGLWKIGISSPQANAESDSESSNPPQHFMTLEEIAVNITSDEESNLNTQPTERNTSKFQTSGFGGRPLWFYLTLAAFGLMTTEWYLYQRRLIG